MHYHFVIRLLSVYLFLSNEVLAADPQLEPLWKIAPGPANVGGCDPYFNSLKAGYTEAIKMGFPSYHSSGKNKKPTAPRRRGRAQSLDTTTKRTERMGSTG